MSDFYSIKDPSLELKHTKQYLCVDDWANVFIAEYDASLDMFVINYASDHVLQRINFIFDENIGFYTFTFDENIGFYTCVGPALSFMPHNVTREDYNPYRGNKIEKVRLFELDIRGVK